MGNSCFSGGTGIAGLLATNAAMYNGTPPVWSENRNSLDFTVASPHLDENGSQSVGTYTLAIPASTVSCLYGRKELPNYAEISVISGSDGVDYTSTVVLQARDGWVNLSAKGFHYSEPTIRVRFSEDNTNKGTSAGTKAQRPRNIRLGVSSGRLSMSFTRVSPTSRYTVTLVSANGSRATAKCAHVAAKVTCFSTKLRRGTWKVSIGTLPKRGSTPLVVRAVEVS